VIGSSIPYENLSTNWSKYSRPWDVIFDFPGYGIARLRVSDLPDNLPIEQPPGTPVLPHSFRPSMCRAPKIIHIPRSGSIDLTNA
jgi:hypothetical protein